jgi:hypothetical protein
MSNIDTNTEPSAAERLDALTERASEGPLDGLYHHESLHRDRGEDLPSAREAADRLIQKRKDDQAKADFHEADEWTDKIQFADKDGSRANPKASATLGDTRKIAEEIGSYREQRQALAAEYLQQQHGDEGEEGDIPVSDQQQSEADLLAHQINAQQAAAEAAQQRAAAMELSRQQQELAKLNEARVQVHQAELRKIWQAEFSDIRTDADLSRVAQQSPARAQRAQQIVAEFTAADQIVQQRHAQEQQQQQRQQQWQQFCSSEDHAFVQAHPELSDAKLAYEVQQECLSYLQDKGFSQRQIAEMYSSDPATLAQQGLTSIRSAQAQAIIYDAVQHRLATRRAKQITAKRLPPVQKPGVARDRAFVDHEHMKSLTDRLDRTGNVRHAAELVRARRAASR